MNEGAGLKLPQRTIDSVEAQVTDRSTKTQTETTERPRPSGQPFDDPALILIAPNQLAEIFLCSERKLERERSAGTGVPFVRIGRLVRYRLIDVREYLEAQRCRSTSDVRSEGTCP